MSEPTGQFLIEGKNLGETIDTIQRWARHTFPEQTPSRVLAHLDEEHYELLERVTAEEIADNVILLVSLADRMGVDILAALQAKHVKNLSRKWSFNPHFGYDKKVDPNS